MTTTPQPAPTRLPRYRRVQRVPLHLTARDIQILKTVKDFRLLTSAHIQALANGSDQQILRRLQKLFHAGYLHRVTPRVSPNGGSTKMVYAVTNKGLAQLQKEGLIAEPSKTDCNENNRSLHDLSIDHMLLLSHLRALFTLACSNRPDAKLLFWREGRALYDAIEVANDQGYVRLPVAPDAYFGLETPKGRTYCFLEADRGTMTTKRYTRKLIAYTAYAHEKKQQERFGIKHFRVLTVTVSAIRQRNLAEAAKADEHVQNARPGMFLFSNAGELPLERPQSVFEKVWTDLADVERHALISD